MRRILVVAAAAFSLLLLSSGVNALPENEVHDYYYERVGNTYTEVGEYDIYCNGAHDSWGQINTPYIYETVDGCSLPGSFSGCYYIDPDTGQRTSEPCWF